MVLCNYYIGAEASADVLFAQENCSQNPISISEVLDQIKAKNVIAMSQPSTLMANQRPLMEPVTPESKLENGEQNRDWSSPLTLVSSPPSSPCFNSTQRYCPGSTNVNTPETVKETLFDSFAPGPQKFILAPDHRKYKKGSRAHVVRRLNFSCLTNLVRDINLESQVETISDEGNLLETVYMTILEVVVSEQTEDLDAKVPNWVSDSDGVRTPETASHVCGVTKTCPGAPRKSTRKYQNINTEICKRLEF